ncbi:MAG: hypothetical protein SFX72_12715 [Isosphaeraceae bacterium]|nr:hypothetical protein [Isosphaeraceae bacterium]
MSTRDRCVSCRGIVDQDDLFCANCGREVPEGKQTATIQVGSRAVNFGCRNCGASMLYDADAAGLKCPFCGSLDVERDETRAILAPDFVLPFEIDRADAENRLRAWLGSSFWAPGDLATAAQLTELRAVYVPFWIFRARVDTNWAADSGRVPLGTRASWYPLAGRREASYDDVWVPASEGLSPTELYGVGPFDPSRSVPPKEVDLAGAAVEQFSVSRKYARPLAKAQLESLEIGAVAAELGGSVRNVRVNVILTDVDARGALVPVYVMAYRYRERLYRFVLNGQTGQAEGGIPRSASKIAGAILLVVILTAAAAGLLLR